MASCDYKSCDICGRKTFYDANLHYDFEEHNKITGLYNTGDMKALCESCSDMYELRVVKITEEISKINLKELMEGAIKLSKNMKLQENWQDSDIWEFLEDFEKKLQEWKNV